MSVWPPFYAKDFWPLRDPLLDEEVEWVPVETDTIIIECNKDPSQEAADVVKKHRRNKIVGGA